MQAAPTSTLSDIDRWWLECFTLLEAHYRRSPVIRELAAYCERSSSVTHAAMTRLHFAGALAQDPDTGKYSTPRRRR